MNILCIFWVKRFNLLILMKVLGFDIGIKNLAYCIVNTDYSIPEPVNKFWNIINVIKDDNKCYSNGCTNNVTKSCIIDNTKYFFCGRHKKVYLELLKSNPIICSPCTKQIKCEGTMSCKTKSMFNYKNKSLCKKHWEIKNKSLNKERAFTPYKLLVDDFTNEEIKFKLFQELEKRKDFLIDVDYVCIENQPAFKNPTMKAISDDLCTWLILRGQIIENRIKRVQFVSPSNKLKVNGKEKFFNSIIKSYGEKQKYEITKKLSIGETRKMLEEYPDYINHLNTFVKKDDMCDAYLHAIYYIQYSIFKKTPIYKQLLKSIEYEQIMKKLKKILCNSVIQYDHYLLNKND